MTDSEDGDRRGDGPSDVSGTDATDGTEDSFGSAEARTRDTEDGPSGVVGWLKWFWTADRGWAIYLRDVTTSVAAVLVIGLLLFAISGIWPPMVAIESGSMEPNMERGDLVFVVDDDRFVPDNAPTHDGRSTGVLPADRAEETGYRKFGRPGDVIVFQRDGRRGVTPVIHRAMLWVEDGENWYDRADPEYMGSASNCEQLNHCPAPHAGFITLGDANPAYDQHRGPSNSLSAPVKPEWIIGTAELKLPYLGQVRLFFSGLRTAPTPAGQAAAESPAVTGTENATTAAVDSLNATATANRTRAAV
jgi:signal peptidase